MNNLKKPIQSMRPVFFFLLFICIIVAAAVLKLAASVILPFTIAFLLALIMLPLINLLDKLKIPRIISVLLCVAIIVFFTYVLGMVLFTSGKSVISMENFTIYETRLAEIYKIIADLMGLPNDESMSLWETLWGQLGIRTWVVNFATSSVSALLSFISSAVMVTIFMAFVLLEASFIREKLEAAFENQSNRIEKIGNDLISQVSRYITAKFIISLATGGLVTLGLWLIGVDFAIVWGIFAFIFNFIPTFGSIASGAVTSLFALVQFWPEPIPVLLTIALMIGVNMVIGNVIDPKVIGDHVGLSPIVVLASMTIWGFIWGFAGMIISVPMTVIIKIICENVSYLEPISILIGSRRATKVKMQETDTNKDETPAVDVSSHDDDINEKEKK